MPALGLARTMYLLGISVFTCFLVTVQANINNHGSSMCFGHHNQLQSLIRQLEEAPYRDQMTFSGSGKWSAVGCITFSDLLPVVILAGGILPAMIAVLGTSFQNTKAEDDGALCAFYQGTRGGVFSLQRTIDSLKELADPKKGNANPCGSIPINWPLNNDTGGILTMNYVAGAPCDGFCIGNKDLAAPGDKALKNDPTHDYAPGWCGAHITWYETTPTIHDNYFDVAIRDANQVLIGAAYYMQAPSGKSVPVDSKLPATLNITAPSNDTLPFKMAHEADSWDSSSHQCVCDLDFQDGFKSCNCGFTCGKALGLLNPP